MNKDQAKGSFDQLKGKIKQTWGRLTDDDIALYNGKQDEFFGKLEEKYGVAKEDAETQLKKLNNGVGDRSKGERAA